jgi:hypothetical protein
LDEIEQETLVGKFARALGESWSTRLELISYKLDAAGKVFVATNINVYF